MEEHVQAGPLSSTFILVLRCILHVDLRCGPASCIMQPRGGVGGGRVGGGGREHYTYVKQREHGN